MPSASSAYEERLRRRFVVARRIAAGEFGGYALPESVLKQTLNVSLKTHQGDIRRAKVFDTFEAWKPGKTGPKPGTRISTRLMRIIEAWTYERASKKRNDRKLSADLASHFEIIGAPVAEQPSESTIRRAILDIYKRDPAHFASQRHGRAGRRLHMLQKGALEAERPLQFVIIDHTPADVKVLSIERPEEKVRPTLTTATDLFTGVMLAGFLSRFPPGRETVAMAMAMIVTNKTDLLRTYRVPGEWECSGLPECVMVDGAGEFDNDSFKWSCNRYGIDLQIGLPGLPEARSPHERAFRTLNSDIHEWPGTTLSNAQMLKSHGGEKDAELPFEEAQRRLLLALMEFNNETYGGSEPPRIHKWRQYQSTHPTRRLEAMDQRRTFIEFLPHRISKLQTRGIKFENCWFRSGDLAKPIYEGRRQVRFHWNPRDVSEIYVSIEDGPYLTIPRATNRHAPKDLYELRIYNKERRRTAEEAKDSLLLAQIREAKRANAPPYLLFLGEDYDRGAAGSHLEELSPPLDLSDFHPKESVDVAAELPSSEPPPEARADETLLGFQIPDFPTRLK
ncbi:Mu transposase C-terminal domain-containing protein [Brevundimonas sp. S1H14]|uniref:Mu transposase C-terminal domain-containing protein n=1 Tax=Brevundimonas sp. S1H14 TaxID=3078084 RepID=UPI0039E8C4EF